MNYETIKNIPTSRDGKMALGIISALVARTSLNQGIALMPTDADGAMFAFIMTAVLLFTTVLAMVRFDTGRPLFEPIKKQS